jgi:hypothetical protein
VRRLEIVDYSYVEFSALELESPVVFRLKTFLRKSRLASHPAQFAGRCHAMVSLGLKDLPGIARSLACIWTPSVSTSTTKESRLIEIAHLPMNALTSSSDIPTPPFLAFILCSCYSRQDDYHQHIVRSVMDDICLPLAAISTHSSCSAVSAV